MSAPDVTATAQESKSDAVTFTVLRTWAPLLVGVVMGVAGGFTSYALQGFRVTMLEARLLELNKVGSDLARGNAAELARLRDEAARLRSDHVQLRRERDSDHQFLVGVAEDLRLFMCEQNRAYCRARK